MTYPYPAKNISNLVPCLGFWRWRALAKGTAWAILCLEIRLLLRASLAPGIANSRRISSALTLHRSLRRMMAGLVFLLVFFSGGWRALAKGTSWAGVYCAMPLLRISSALPHVHLRSQGSRPGFCRVLSVEFFVGLVLNKRFSRGLAGRTHSSSTVLTASAPTRFAWVCPPRFMTRIARRLLGLSPSPMSSDERVGLEPELPHWSAVQGPTLACGGVVCYLGS